MFTVGAIIDRPQTTAKQKRETNGRPYKQIGRDIVFSADLCYTILHAQQNPDSDLSGRVFTIR